MRHASLFAATLLLAACATTPTGLPAPQARDEIPSEELGLGEWRSASESATLDAFQQSVTGRYREGVSVSAVAADLRRNEFNCGEAPAQDQGRGDPPAQVCRRTVTLEGCTHTWQVHVFGDALLSRTRGLYDRRCGNEGLLGGPG